MLKPSDLRDDLVTYLRSMPDLVQAMDGDPENIFAHVNEYPIGDNFDSALRNLKSPRLMVRYRYPGPAAAGMGYSHTLSLYARPKAGHSYEELLDLIINSTATGKPIPFGLDSFNDDVCPAAFTFTEPMPDEEGTEFLQIDLTVDER